MSSNREDLIQEVIKEFSGDLQLKLPLEHFSQFYEEFHFNDGAQKEAKETLMTFQKNSKLSIQETLTVATELFSRIQGVIEQWKTKNDENKTQCRQFLLSQIDFLLNDFRTWVMIKLVSAPDVGVEDLKTFLERRKTVLIDVFDKLSKPGDPQSSVDMKATLDEKLECLKIESLQKQRLYLEQKTAERALKVIDEAKRTIMKIASQLKSDLNDYQGSGPKELVKTKLGEINYFLSMKGKGLNDYHPNIYSAVLRTTAEVRKCLEEVDYEDMTAKEIAETLYEQLLYDFSDEIETGRQNSSELELDSINFDDEGACAVSQKEQMEVRARKRNDVCSNGSEAQLGQLNELQNFVEEEVIKEKKEEYGVDHGRSKPEARSSNVGAALTQFGNDGENSDEEEENEMTESGKSAEEDLERGRGDSNVSNASQSARNFHCISSRRISARVQNSSKPIPAKHSGRKRRSVVMETRKPMDDDGCPASSSEDCEDSTSEESNGKEIDYSQHKRYQVGSSKPNRRKSVQAGKHRLNVNVGEKKTDKITYLSPDKRGKPMFRCNVCNRKCEQHILKYHGEHCGKSDDPFACKECGKTFVHKSHLNRHARIHTGEKPFKCSRCSRRFAQNYHLKSHMRSHNRKAPFICEPCQLTFSSNLCLHQHKNLKHKAKLPFGCVNCEERFDTMYKLKNHVITHTDIRPFRCPTCDLSATTKYNLANHIRGIHSQPRQAAQKLANEAAIAYLIEETKDDSYRDIPHDKINSLVVSHIIKKAKLKLPETATRKTAPCSSNS